MGSKKDIFSRIRKYIELPGQLLKSKAVDTVESECFTLQQLFSVIAAGSFIGLPATPVPITLELLPYMEEDLISLINQIDTTDQPLSYLFSVMNVT